jgi:hypothetical protein
MQFFQGLLSSLKQIWLEKAKTSKTLDQGPHYEWQPTKSSKRSHQSAHAANRSFAAVVRADTANRSFPQKASQCSRVWISVMFRI